MQRVPNEIMLGDSIVFSWTVTNAESFYMLPDEEPLEPNGSIVFKPDNTARYQFRAVAGEKKSNRSYNVVVRRPEISVNVPRQVSDERDFKIEWTTNYVDSVAIAGYSDSLPLSGKMNLNVANTGEILKVIAYNKFGATDTFSHKLNIKYEESFSHPEAINKGEDLWFKWKFKNSQAVVVQGINKTFSPIDSVMFSPDHTTQFSFYVVRDNGDTSAFHPFVTVRQSQIIRYTANNYIYKGDEAVLSWETQLVRYVKIDGVGDSLPSSGQIRVKPDKRTQYKLTAYSRWGELSAAQIVHVISRRFIVGDRDYSTVKPNERLDFEMYAVDMSYYPDSVRILVLVVDTAGHFVTGLAPPYGTQATANKYFRGLTERTASGRNHSVKNFSVREVRDKSDIPIDVNITLDYSGSMWLSIDYLEEAFRKYVKLMPEKSRLSLVRFSDTIITQFPLISNKNDMIKMAGFVPKLKDTLFYSTTALYAAADEGLITLEKSPNAKQMLLFTDGYENASFPYIGKRAIFAQQVAKKAKEMRVRLNSIAYGGGANETVLKFLSAITGGTYYDVIRPEDIEKVFNECLYLNRNYYVITYKPLMGQGNNNLTLTYNNNLNQNVSTHREVYIGDDFDLTPLESGTSTTYWNTSGKWGAMKPSSMPQSVATFDFGRSQLLHKNYKKIEPFITYLKDNPSAKIVIFGHTDNIGSDQSCDLLSEHRAKAVKDYLMQNEIPESQIEIEACGKRFPIWAIEDKDWKAAENRRVELLLIQ